MQQNLWSPECPWILYSGQVSKNCLGLVGTSPPIRRWIRTSVASRRLFKRCSSDLMKSSNFRCLETTRVDLMCWIEVGFEVSEDQPSSTSGYIRYPVDINDINESYRSYVSFWLILWGLLTHLVFYTTFTHSPRRIQQRMIPTFPVDKPHSLELLPHAAPPRKWWNNKGKLTLRSSVFSFCWLVVRTRKKYRQWPHKIEESAAKGLFCHNGLLFSQQFLQTCSLQHGGWELLRFNFSVFPEEPYSSFRVGMRQGSPGRANFKALLAQQLRSSFADPICS